MRCSAAAYSIRDIHSSLVWCTYAQVLQSVAACSFHGVHGGNILRSKIVTELVQADISWKHFMELGSPRNVISLWVRLLHSVESFIQGHHVYQEVWGSPYCWKELSYQR